jgi:hypothetical protein
MKEILVIGSLLIFCSCTYLEEHPEVVEEGEKVLVQVAESAIESEIEKESR